MSAETALALSSLLTLFTSIVLTSIAWRIKSSQDARIETLKSDLDRQLHISQLTFDKEFEILSELWNAFVDLRDSALHLDPNWVEMDLHASAEQIEQRNKSRYDRYLEHRASFLHIFEKNRPFYPQDIYDILHKFEKATQTRDLISFVSEQKATSESMLRDIQKVLVTEIIEANDLLCSAIRNQITGNKAKHAK